MRTLLKVLGVLAVIAVASVIMLALGGMFIARNIHVNEQTTADGKSVAIKTPLGDIKVHKNDSLDPETIGVPVYPGARRDEEHGGAEFEIDAGDFHKHVAVSGAVYWTDDDAEKVRDFYKEKFPEWNQSWQNSEFKIESKGDGRVRSVQIREKDGRTRIAVATLGPPAAN